MPKFKVTFFLLLAVFFGAYHLLALRKTGIQHGGDTPRYTEGAEHLLTGQPFQDKEASYLGYVGFVALCQKYFGVEKSVIFLQVILSFLACFLVFLMATELAGERAGYFAAALFALNPDYVQWNTFILTDSLYISCLVFATFCLWKATIDFKRWTIPAIFIVGFTILIRPTGWVLLPATTLFCLFHFPKLTRFKKWVFPTLAVFFLLPFLVPKLRYAVEKERPANKIQYGEIICEYHDLMVAMPEEPQLKAGGIESAVKYVFLHPLSVLKLGVVRIFAVLAHIRPYYSKFHNLQILLFIYPIYLFSFLGFYFSRRTTLNNLALTILTAHLLLIAVSFADWDGRYLMQFFPVFQLMAGVGLAVTVDKLAVKLRSQRLQYQL